MLNEIYSRRILELAADIPHLGRLPDADATATARSKLCGSTVTVGVKLDGNVVTAFAQDVKACALGQASSSIMGRHIIGSTVEELRDLRETATQLLKAGGEAPYGKWEDLKVLEPLRDYKARHASILLTFDAVVDAINQIEARRGQDAG
jgi:NifU-like protein involved in Fe-S cluster formation